MRYGPALALLPLLLFGCGIRASSDAAKSSAAPSAAKDQRGDDRRGDNDGPGVTVGKDAQARGGIAVAALAAHALQPELTAYGRLEEDPSESFVARAPVAGMVQVSPGREWPALGQTLAAGAFGQIEPRLSLTDRVGLNTQRAAAQADVNASVAAVTAAQTAYDRARALNADNKNISDRALQEAAAKLAAEQAHEAGARATLQVLDTSLASAGTSSAQPVAAGRGGDVVEVLAQPGESVEQGAALIRIARFDRLLARIDLPVGEHLPAGGVAARIVPAGFEDRPPLPAERLGTAAASDARTQGVSLLYRLSRTFPGLRPGAAVTAHFTLPGAAGQGVLIPRGAVVQQDGRSWAYVQVKENRFSRRAVPLDLPEATGFIAGHGFAPGDRIVVTGAQTLLSEEFKSLNEADPN